MYEVAGAMLYRGVLPKGGAFPGDQPFYLLVVSRRYLTAT